MLPWLTVIGLSVTMPTLREHNETKILLKLPSHLISHHSSYYTATGARKYKIMPARKERVALFLERKPEEFALIDISALFTEAKGAVLVSPQIFLTQPVRSFASSCCAEY